MATSYGSAHSKGGSSGSSGSDSNTIQTGTRVGEAHESATDGVRTGTQTGSAYSGATQETGDFAPEPVEIDDAGTRIQSELAGTSQTVVYTSFDGPTDPGVPSRSVDVTAPDSYYATDAYGDPGSETHSIDADAVGADVEPARRRDDSGSFVSEAREQTAGVVGGASERVSDVVDDPIESVRGGADEVVETAGTFGERVSAFEPPSSISETRDLAGDVRQDVGARVPDDPVSVGRETVDRAEAGAGEARDRVGDVRQDVRQDVDERVPDPSVPENVGTVLDESGAAAAGVAEDPVGIATERVEQGVWERVGGDAGAFGEEGVSPTARMTFETDEAIEARAEQEQEILGWREDVDEPSDVPAGVAGGMFGLGQEVSRGGVVGGERISSGVRAANPVSGMGPTIGEESLGSVPGNVAGGGVASGGMALGSALQLPASTAADVQDIRAGEETPTEAAGGSGEATQQFLETQAEMVRDYPVSTAAGFALPTPGAATSGLRGYRATRGTRGRVGLGEITTKRGARGELPDFDTPRRASAGEAIGELETRMADQPEVVTSQTSGEGVLFHSTSEPFGRRVEIGEGASEYPGLFTSPEVSPLGLSEISGGYSRSIGLGDYSTTPEAVPGFRPRGMEGMPRRAAESGYAVRGADGDVVETGLSRAEANRLADDVGGERAPDPTTAGYEYMTQEAPTGEGIVRAAGDRTPEMEAILAPDSEFGQSGGVGIELPDGRVVRGDLYEPLGEPARGGRTAAGAADEVATGGEIASRASRSRTSQPDVAVENVFGPLGSAGAGTRTAAADADADASTGVSATRTADAGETMTARVSESGEPDAPTSGETIPGRQAADAGSQPTRGGEPRRRDGERTPARSEPAGSSGTTAPTSSPFRSRPSVGPFGESTTASTPTSEGRSASVSEAPPSTRPTPASDPTRSFGESPFGSGRTTGGSGGGGGGSGGGGGGGPGGPPGVPGAGQPRGRGDEFDGGGDRDDRREEPLPPETPLFRNPIATGVDRLTGAPDQGWEQNTDIGIDGRGVFFD